MTKEIFIGIDPSFTGCGIVAIDENAKILKQELIKTNNKKSIEERLIELREKIKKAVDYKKLKMIYIEGPSFGSTGQFVLQMGALHFIIRLLFFENKMPYSIKTPGDIKKFVSGKGNAKKDLMLLKVYKKWGVEFEDDNICDAYSLARLALKESTNE